MLALPALAALLLLGATPAAADIPTPGRTTITRSVTLDFGVYADYTTRVHKVAKGDTLASIAKAKLGAASRWQEIQRLNPEVKADELGVGYALLIPPAKKPLAAKAAAQGEAKAPQDGAGPHPWWHFFSVPQPSGRLKAFAHGQKVPVDHYGTTVIAVRDDGYDAFMEQWNAPKASGWKILRDLKKQPPAWLAIAAAVQPGRDSVKSSSPIRRIEQEQRIRAIRKGTVHTSIVRTRYFDGNGKELTSAQVKQAGARRNFLFLLIAGAGLAGLFFVLRRRRAAVGHATA